MYRKHLKSLFLLFCLSFAIKGVSQTSKGSISGRVIDRSGAAIKGASIRIQPRDVTTISDELGRFLLSDIAPGIYTISITSAGFSPYSASVTVAGGQTAQLEAQLTVASGKEDVIVTAESAHTEMEAINQQRTADNIVQVMSADVIASLPNLNVAEAIGRLPGVTLQRDEGEAVYIQIRGLDPRFSNVTVDGVTLPSPESSVRQVNLATIPSNLVQAIEVNKTLSADQDADGIGGSVNLVTKRAGERPTLNFGSTIGYMPMANGRYLGQLDGTAGRRFGYNKRLGIILGGSYDYNGRGFETAQPAPDVDPGGTTLPYYDNITLREYRYDRHRWGLSGGTDYRLNDHSSLFLHGLFSDFKDWGDKWYYQVTTKGSPKFYESKKSPDFAVGSVSLGGNHVLNASWINWELAVSRSRELNSGGNPKVTFNPNSSLKTFGKSCTFDPTEQAHTTTPQWAAICMVATSPIFNPANYTMNQFVTTSGQSVQLNLQGGASMAFNYHLGSHFATFEFGGKVRNAHKFQNAYTPTYDAGSGIGLPQFIGGFRPDHFYQGAYNLGPLTDYNKIKAFFLTNPLLFSLDASTTHLDSDPNNFNLIERVSAGYVMNTLELGKLRLQTGLRLEGTQLNTLGNITNADADGNWISTTSQKNSQSYFNPLPSIQARYAISKDSAIRGVYARGISRPNPYDLIPYRIENDSSVPQLTVGNPSLKPTHANNYDVLFEQYLQPFGLLEAGFFYKQLSNPIFLDQSVVPNSTDVQAQMVNGTGAHVTGLEFSLQQRLSYLPGPLQGLGLAANYAYIASRTDGVPNRTDHPALVGQAKHSFNVNPYYELGRISAHVGLSYNGANIYAYQFVNDPAPGQDATAGGIKGPLSDNYYYPHMQLDAQASVRLIRGLRLVANGINLTNEVFGFYNGSPRYMTQREFYRPAYSASLRWTSGSEH